MEYGNCQKYINKDERCVDLTEITFRDQKTPGKVLCTFHILYASESWTQNKQMEDKINDFEMWIFRYMFGISHLDRKTTVKVLEMAKAKHTSEDYTSEETTICWTLDKRKGKTKTTDGTKDIRDKTQRKAKKDLDK